MRPIRVGFVGCVLTVCGAYPGTSTAGEPVPAPAAIEPDEDLRPFPTPEYGQLLTLGMRGMGLATRGKGGALVDDGLRYLVSKQDGDGCWRAEFEGSALPRNDIGVTALAVLAILGAGWSPTAPGPHSAAAARGLAALRLVQAADGAFRNSDSNEHMGYGHAFATLAFVEAFAMSGNATYHAVAQKGLDYVFAARNPYYAWKYGVRPGTNDTPSTACMWSVIHAAQLLNADAVRAGLRPAFRVDDEAVFGVQAWVDRMTDPETGRVGYEERGSGSSRQGKSLHDSHPTERSEALTAAGVFIRATAGESFATSPMIKLGARRLLASPPTWNRSDGSIDLFHWYFASLAWRFIEKGAKADGAKWNEALVSALGSGRTADGVGAHWEPLDPWGREGGVIYTTAMAVLALENRWRYPIDPNDRTDVLAALDSEAPAFARVVAIRALTFRSPKGIASRFARLLKAKPAEVRRAAAEALVGLATRAEVPWLAEAVMDVDEATSTFAARNLGRFGVDGVAALVGGLSNSAAHVRRESARALSQIGAPAADRAVAPLRVALADADPMVRVAAAAAVFSVAGEVSIATPVLVVALESPDAATRREAAIVLASMRASASSGEKALTAHANDPDLPARLEIVAALVAARGPRLGDSDLVISALEHADAELRRRACEVLSAMGPALHSAIPAISLRLTDSDSSVRRRAAQALGAAGREARDAIPALRLASIDLVASVRRAATDGLASIVGPIPVRPDAPASTPSPGVLEDVAKALGDPLSAAALRSQAAGVISLRALIAAGSDPAPVVRVRAVELLGDRGSADASDATALLRTRAADADAGVRASAIRALVKLLPTDAATRSLLVDALADRSEAVRTAALDAFAVTPSANPAAIPTLGRIVIERGPAEAIAAADLLGVWNATDPKTVDALQTALTMPSPDAVSLTIVRNLVKFRPVAESTPGALEAAYEAATPPLRAAYATLITADARSEASLREGLVRRWEMSSPNAGIGGLVVAIGEPAAMLVAERLGHADATVRERAARLLTAFGSRKLIGKALPSIVDRLRCDEPGNCTEIADALRVGEYQKPAGDALVRGLKHRDALVRGGAALVIGELFRSERPAPSSMIAALRSAKSAETDVRAESAMVEAIRRLDW